MEKVDAFKANDGSLWKTEQECLAHEVTLKWKEKIENFLRWEHCPYRSGTAQGNMSFKLLSAWEMFKELNGK